MKRRQTEIPIPFTGIRSRILMLALLGVLGVFAPGLHSQVSLFAVMPSSENQTGLNGTAVLTSSENAPDEHTGRIDQSVIATYTGNLSPGARNASQASLKLQAIVSARRALSLAPGSARINGMASSDATRAAEGYAVAQRAGVHRESKDPMAELSQSIGPAYGGKNVPVYVQAAMNQPVASTVFTSDLEHIGGWSLTGGLDSVGGVEKIGDSELGNIDAFLAGFGTQESLCGEGCVLTAGSSRSTSATRRRSALDSTLSKHKLEDKSEKLGQMTTVNTTVRTGTN